MDLYLRNLLHTHPASLESLGDDPGAKLDTFSSTGEIYEGLYDYLQNTKAYINFPWKLK